MPITYWGIVIATILLLFLVLNLRKSRSEAILPDMKMNLAESGNDFDEYNLTVISSNHEKSDCSGLSSPFEDINSPEISLSMEEPEQRTQFPHPHELEFVKKVKELIKEKLASPEFNISYVYKKMGVSRSLFFSKYKRITGETPYALLINERMKYAASLLVEQPQLNITEISDKTGFASPVYFSRSFKKQYGLSPLNYRKNFRGCAP